MGRHKHRRHGYAINQADPVIDQKGPARFHEQQIELIQLPPIDMGSEPRGIDALLLRTREDAATCPPRRASRCRPR